MPAPSKSRARRAAPSPADAGRSGRRSWSVLLTVAALLIPLAACQNEPPEERVARLRADYQAELSGFLVRERPIAPTGAAGEPPAGAEAAPTEPEAAQPGTAEPGDAAPETVPPLPDEAAVERDVVLDIMLRNRGDESLPGITLDIEQVDAQERVKANYKIYVDAAGATPGGQPAAVSHVLEDVDFAPGDKFAVEVRSAVPPEARGDYRELAEAAEGSAP
ncbi:MAG TPA: hypothetical protein VHQ65_12450 [Thermoanaerobaculia bacterium]|nr:hypothetical protein [Thermoanaerobaculia bacterium]